jgi:predicted aldo/keto reductase-like oxidoreductase
VVFGRTGLKITKISFGGIMTQEPSVLVSAIEQGFNVVHTALGYTNGRSIEAFGKVMPTQRKNVVLLVKGMPGSDLDKSLKILNTDYADFIIPSMDSVAEISDPKLHEAFAKAKKEGKVGHLGFSCHTSDPKIIDAMIELGIHDGMMMTYNDTGNVAFMSSLERARRAGIGILAIKGLPKRATGTPTAEQRATYATLCRSMIDNHAHSVLASMGSFQAVEMFREILQTNLSYYNPALEKQWRASLMGHYCAMCGNCTGVCPNGVAFKDIIRFRMYHQDYNLPEYARTEYAALGMGCNALNCKECGFCEGVCSRRLPVREILKEAHSMLA